MTTTISNRAGTENPCSRPVFIAKMRGFPNGHAWVIDGWLEEWRTKTRIGADGRLTPVIAITEAGQISATDFIPREADAALTLDDLWVEEDEDYLLGGVEPANGPSLVAEMIISYAARIILDPNPPTGTDNDSGSGGGSQGGYPPSADADFEDTYTYVREWVQDSTRAAILTTRWYQNSPFNDLCPVMGNGENAPAGCVAIAVMQILACHETPTVSTFPTIKVHHLHVTPVSWNSIKDTLNTGAFNGNTTYESIAVACISKDVGIGVNMQYNILGLRKGSFATPAAAARYLRGDQIKYKSAKKYNWYKEDLAKESILAGRPVFIGGITGLAGGHAWVLDGWMERHERQIAIRDSDGHRTVVNENVREQTLVHCNWGWGRSYDGYYISGVFKLKNGAEEIGDGDSGATGSSDNYDAHLRMVTYELP